MVLLEVPRVLVQLLRECDNNPYALPPTKQGDYHHSRFAVMSRLLTCLVNERLVRACCVTTTVNNVAVNFLVVVRKGCESIMEQQDLWSPGTFVFQLRHRPMVNEPGAFENVRC
ncbi:hypothetical protein EC988_008561, partial [Linderina pennispora]